MKCNKCSTPIIPGETRCRFCGSTITNEVIKSPEIIDIIDDTIFEKQPEEVLVATKKDMKKEPEIIDIIDEIIDVPKKEEKKVEIKNKIDITDELDKTTNLEKIDITEFTGKISKEEVKKIEKKEESKKQIKKEEVKKQIEKKEEVKEQTDKKEESKKQIKKEEDNNTKKEESNNNKKQFNENANLYIIIIVTGVLLIISLVFNLFLFLNRNITKKISKENISNTKIESFFNNYELSIPDNWYTKTEVATNNFIIFDSSNEWGASLQVLNDIEFKKINKNADKIQEEYAKRNYIFTSNYTKNINNTDYFLYKGKYENYSVYLIIEKIDNKNVLVTTLKFKGEIKKDVFDTILESFSTIKNNNLSKLYENDFEFKPVDDIINQFAKIETEIAK